MSNVFRRLSVWCVVLCGVASLSVAVANGQETPPLTGFQKVMDRIDLAASVDGLITTTVSGTEKRDLLPESDRPSSTAGALITLRYTKAPLLGFEFNYSYSRYTQNYSSTSPALSYLPGVQNNVAEETLGYVAHLHPLFGVKPFLGAGGGTMRFKPTPNGGEGLSEQYRAVYYYDAGAEKTLLPNFGVRVAFRQLIYLAPDFGQNYLTITRRAVTTEPTFGFFLRF